MPETSDPAMKPKRRVHPLLLAAGLGALLAALILAMPPQGRSERKTAVAQLMQAAAAGDQSVFDALVVPNAEFWTLSDVVSRVRADTLKEMVGSCRVLRMYEGLDTVSVQFDCARDAHGRYFLEFTFCGDKVNEAIFPEWGRMIPSPTGRDLMERALGLVQDDMGPCAKGLSSRMPDAGAG